MNVQQVKVNHISIKLVMNDETGIRQVDFPASQTYVVPTTTSPPMSMALANETFRWGIGNNAYLCKLFITNQGSEEISYQINPSGTGDINTSTILKSGATRALDFLTTNCIEKINVKVNGPGFTTVLLEGYAFNKNS